MRMLSIIFFFVATALSGSVISQVWMVPNRGQWDDRILYNVELSSGNMFVEKTGFTFSFSNLKQVLHHPHESSESDHENESMRGHVVRSTFMGASNTGSIKESDSSDFYSNYLIGNDPARWQSGIRSVLNVEMTELYPGIQMLLNGEESQLEYAFTLSPGAEPAQIKQLIEGHDKLWVDDQGLLHIEHSFGEIVQSAPVAWTEKEGRKRAVNCRFALNGSVLSFELGEYDSSAKLIIDPSLTFSTFTGSTVDNWGFTAAPDPSAGWRGRWWS